MYVEIVLSCRFSDADHLHPGPDWPEFEENHYMAKGQQRGNREARKPKKPEPPKQNASAPSLKGPPQTQPPKRG